MNTCSGSVYLFKMSTSPVIQRQQPCRLTHSRLSVRMNTQKCHDVFCIHSRRSNYFKNLNHFVSNVSTTSHMSLGIPLSRAPRVLAFSVSIVRFAQLLSVSGILFTLAESKFFSSQEFVCPSVCLSYAMQTSLSV